MSSSKKPSGRGRPSGSIPKSSPGPGKRLIFRRFRTVNGKKLDAHDYGYKAWPIWVKR